MTEEFCESCRHWTRNRNGSPIRGTCRVLSVLDGYHLTDGTVTLEQPTKRDAGTWDLFGCPLHDERPKPFHVTIDPKRQPWAYHVVLRAEQEIVGE